MPESEFDKQVQQEMEGLRIRPSAVVWENVEKELRRKKRRRFIVAFWMIAGIALLGSTTYLLTRNNDTTLTATSAQTGTPPGTRSTQPTVAKGIQPPAQDPVKSVSTQTDTTATRQQNSTGGDQPAALSENAPEKSNTVAKAPASKDDDKKVAVGSGKPAANQHGHIHINVSAKNKKAGSSGKKTSSETTDPAVAKGKIKRVGKVSGDNTPVTPALQTEAQNPVNTAGDIVANGKEFQNTITQATPVADSAQSASDSVIAIIKDDNDNGVPVKTPQKKEAKKIKWSLDLAVGGSGPVSRPFLVGDNHAGMAYDNVQYAPVQGGGLWQPVNPPANAFGPVYSPRSDINPGLSYRAGVLVDLPVSARVSFSSGLQYHYQSNNIRIGNYVNTQLVFNNFASQQVRANGVYQGVQMKTFTNKYHYVQIPLLLNWQMNKSKKLPLILNTGFSAGYLASTNALTYDTLQGGTYYHEKNAFKRFQFSFTTGVSFRFGSTRALQWSIGPEASMGLRKTVKTEYDTRQYPVYIGLQGRIYLPKKKQMPVNK